MQLQSSSHYNNDNDCMFCDGDGESLTLMMNEALVGKHTNNQSQALIGYIDVIMRLQQPCNAQEAWAAYQFRQCQVSDQIDQFLKRQYAIGEYSGKINMLTEYYKFHSDVPRVVELSIEKILGKYYDKKREHDYKKIKRILKQEQGLSITSVQQSQSSIDGTQYQKKSRYSNLLDGLEESKLGHDTTMSDSKLLNDMCKIIEKALPTSKLDRNFQIKGSFSRQNQDKNFEEYLKQEQRRLKQKSKKNEQARFPRSRFNLQQLLKKREKGKKQKQANFRDSRETKKKQKDKKFIYNTNIKIQIKNAMFYSQGQQPPLQMGNLAYQAGNKLDTRFRKKNLINQVNYPNHESNKKIVAQIYKSSHEDLKRRMQNNLNQQRLATKESINRSQSKDKKRSLSKGSTILMSNKQLKKHSSGSTSARRLAHNNDAILSSKQPGRSTSATNIKKRSYSNSNNGTPTVSVATLPVKTFQKRPIQSISKYGSSDMRYRMESITEEQREKRVISIKELLNRKLTFKKD